MTVKDTIARRRAYGLGSGFQDLENLPIIASRAPLTTDLSYPIGQVWIHQAVNKVYALTSVAAGVANWEIMGGQGMSPITEYVVAKDGSGDYTTIQAAINAANTAGGVAMIYIRGHATTYTENLTLYDNLIFKGDGIQTSITGVHTPPAAGAVLFFDIYFISATDVITSAAAGTTRLRFIDCAFNCTNGYIVDCANWTGPIDLFSCETSSTADGIARIGASTLIIKNSTLGAGATALSITGGTLVIMSSRINCPISPAGACAASITQGCFIGGTVTTAGTVALLITNSTMSTGANAALSHGSAGAVTLSDVVIITAADPAIAGAGAGALTLGGIKFTSGRNLAATLTLAHFDEFRADKLVIGDTTYRTNPFGVELNMIGAYGITTGGVANATYAGITGNLIQDIGDGTPIPKASQGVMTIATGANILQTMGVYGLCIQNDGSVIASTAAGVEGHLNLLEVNAADLPAVYAFGVKGYLDTVDGAGVPGGMTAGVGSIVEYNTPFNAKAYGFVATRLNAGAGAGTAGHAAYGVLQGTVAAPDWLYGLDLASGAQVYTNADIRLWSGSTIASDATNTTLTAFAGDNLIVQLGDNAAANTMIVRNTTPATLVSVDSLGRVTKPLQPAFLAYLAAAVVDKTGNGAIYTIGTDALTEVYDRGGHFNVNGTFTAPVTGIYDLRAQVYVSGTTIATTFVLSIVTTARTYIKTFVRAAGAQDMVLNISCLADMAATNTAVATIQVTGEAGDTDDINGGASCLTYFCGALVE